MIDAPMYCAPCHFQAPADKPPIAGTARYQTPHRSAPCTPRSITGEVETHMRAARSTARLAAAAPGLARRRAPPLPRAPAAPRPDALIGSEGGPGRVAAQAAADPQQQQAQLSGMPRREFCLVKNGELVACAEGAGAWLQAAPRGAYTTARTVGDGARVLKLSSHVARLAQSATLMAQADSQLVTSEGPPGPSFSPEQLRPCVLSCVGATIAAFREGACAGGGAGAAPAQQACETGEQQQQQEQEGDGAVEGEQQEQQEQRQGGGAAEGEQQQEQRQLKLTMLMTWRAAGDFDLWCHGEALPPRPRPPVRLQIRGLPRANARAKDSEWVRQRRALEATKPPGVNEVVLATPGGELMEGLSSNFFALQGGALVTADEGVLSGTVREVVLQVCHDLGLPVHLRPPKISEAPEWQAAFISSTSRLLLPADEVSWVAPPSASCGGDGDNGGGGDGGNGGGGGGGAPQSRAFERHPLAARLEAAVAARILRESEAVPLPGALMARARAP
ncbi:MAG: hypothetical protein J3K34DRAFT_123071 [Monoraphidium minutum]|nr:MAG: hypothetical protein J3K34DRAFT_123071 [Monoraphidium minutum]